MGDVVSDLDNINSERFLCYGQTKCLNAEARAVADGQMEGMGELVIEHQI